MVNSIPSEIVKDAFADCLLLLVGFAPGEGWAATLALRGAAIKNVEAVPEEDRFRFSFTADLPCGDYWWQVQVVRGAEKHFPDTGRIKILPNLFDAPAGYDGSSEAEKALAAITATLANTATVNQLRYRIKDRELQRYSIAELIQLQSFFAAKVRREKGRLYLKPIKVRL